jgi:uncharacterized protein YqcC (DUF446 family)
MSHPPKCSRHTLQSWQWTISVELNINYVFQVHGSVHQRWQQWIKTNQMHTTLKIIKTLLYSYSALHVSGTLAPIIRSLLILHIQPPDTRWLEAVCAELKGSWWWAQECPKHVLSSDRPKLEDTTNPTGGCMCRIRRLLMMGARVPETCRAE